ncbi:glycosyltransferase [Yersinia mollaretii]|uniref:glycosyltransferase n=2 Tax=Yersinia mollaretii TaxID=33060 RepID=UPI0005E49F7A|nr:glycosyltransferase [Yersinia mollaretii]MDN0111190.1 glycosyltransferase [Yersinia mollaretii]PJE89564.1 galactosyltransferase [Yersinia mollaretii]CQH00841.1 putative galactosyltransferase [Yersinia mollaretii]
MNKKICILHNSIKTVMIFRVPYIKTLLSMGYQVYCIAPNDDEAATQKLKKMGVKVLFVSNRNYFSKWYGINYNLLSLLVKKRFNIVVISHFITTFIFSLPSVIFSNKNIIFIEGIGTFFTKKIYLKNILRFLLTTIGNKRIFMNSYERDLIGKKDDLILGGIGIDIDKFYFPASRFDKKECINLLYVGRLVEDKGILDVIILIRLLEEKNINFKLHVVGDVYPANPSSIRTDEIKTLEIEFGDKISFHGYVDDVREFYKKADVLLLLSKHEGFPVVVMEASASGLPSVCYAVPGCIDAISQGVNGFLFEPGNIMEICELLVSVDFSAYRNKCINYAKNNFNQIEKNTIIIDVIEEIK